MVNQLQKKKKKNNLDLGKKNYKSQIRSPPRL